MTTRNFAKRQKNFLLSAGLNNEEIEENFSSNKNQPVDPPLKNKGHRKIIKKKDRGSDGRRKIHGSMHISRPRKKKIVQAKSEQIIQPMKQEEVEEKGSLFEKLVQKIRIVKSYHEGVLEGCFGHATAIFKRPIVEGSYYMQFKELNPNLKDIEPPIKAMPGIRIGLCPFEYSLTIPLGQGNSVGYKKNSGEIVTSGLKQQLSQSCNSRSILGLGIVITPPHKFRDASKIQEGSKMIIYENGKPLITYENLHQEFFCPAISLYNYARVEVRISQQKIKYLPDGMKAYIQILDEEIKYEDLKKNGMFTPIQ